MRRAAAFLGTAALCLNPVSSLVVLGWLERQARRSVLSRWWEARTEPAVPLDDFLAASDPAGGRLSPFFSGAKALFNTYVLTLPGCVLWLFAWYDGWNNSFDKGYEQAWVAPVTGLFGTALFAAAMLYVPLAQARQAASGEWRDFYRFDVVWAVARTKWLSCASLAALYAALSVPLFALRSLPSLFTLGQAHPGRFLLGYSYLACLYVLAACAAARLAAARVYAAGLLELVRAGELPPERLAAREREALGRLGLLRSEPPAPRHVLLRALGWAGTRTGLTLSTTGALGCWGAFVFLIFASQFFNFRPRSGWLNQPFVQMPWFRLRPFDRITR